MKAIMLCSRLEQEPLGSQLRDAQTVQKVVEQIA
jgi:hypothetical protein